MCLAMIVHTRADAAKPFMGLTHVRPGGGVRKQDVGIAKNYLQPEELDALNRIVTAYLEFAELQARGRRLPARLRADMGVPDAAGQG